MAVLATSLGFPRMGANRELKKALEAYWRGATTAAELAGVATELRERHWRFQAGHGIDHVPSGDFSLYDHVLDAAELVGAVPDRYRPAEGVSALDRYFAMARGGSLGDVDVTAMEMTKWFDTNYHYLVPEIDGGADIRAVVDAAGGPICPRMRAWPHDPTGPARSGVVPRPVPILGRWSLPRSLAESGTGLRRDPQ